MKEVTIDISNNPKAQELVMRMKRDKEEQMNQPVQKISQEEFNRRLAEQKRVEQENYRLLEEEIVKFDYRN